MKIFKLFNFLKRENVKQEKVQEIKTASIEEQEVDLTNAPQLIKDAHKCKKCGNTKYCACNRVAKYLLSIGLEKFEKQAYLEKFPIEIQEAINAMDYNLIFAYETCNEYLNILKAAQNSAKSCIDKYLLQVGIEEFNKQFESKTLPPEINKAISVNGFYACVKLQQINSCS